jgi:hypothetical protein
MWGKQKINNLTPLMCSIKTKAKKKKKKKVWSLQGGVLDPVTCSAGTPQAGQPITKGRGIENPQKKCIAKKYKRIPTTYK